MSTRTVIYRSLSQPAVALLTVVVLLSAPSTSAEVNQVTGGIAGLNNASLIGGDGTGDARIEVSGTDLALRKQARDLAGVILTNGSAVSGGQTIYFVLIVDNTTSFPAADVRLTDILDEAEFTYVPGSLEEVTVASGASDAAIWAGTWTPQTDAVGAPDDFASVTDSGGPAGLDLVTIGRVAGQVNATLNVPGTTLRAFRFRVTVN